MLRYSIQNSHTTIILLSQYITFSKLKIYDDVTQDLNYGDEDDTDIIGLQGDVIIAS